MKTKSKNFIVPLVVYAFEVMVSLNQSENDLRKEMKKYACFTPERIESYFEDTVPQLGRATMFDGQVLIRIMKYPVTNEDYAVIVHEVFHAVCFIFKRVNIKLCPKSDEAWAYLIEYLTKEIYNKI